MAAVLNPRTVDVCTAAGRVQFWLGEAERDQRSLDRLEQIRDAQRKADWTKRKLTNSPDAEALGDGAHALRERRNEAVKTLRECGGLLHLWCVPGVAA